MVSTVGTRPNHYELLGLTPKATGNEIAQAFAMEMSMFRPHSFGGLADLSIAYETLRDPARRRAYDASIGVAAEPKPPAVPQGWQFVGSLRAGPVAARPAIDPLHRPAPARAEPETRAEPPVDQRVAAIVASLRELAKPAADAPSAPPRAELEQQPRPPERQADVVDPVIEQILAVGHAEKEQLRDEGRPFEWKRPAMAAAGLVLGVGLLGAWAGSQAGNEIEPEQAGKAVTLAVPPAKTAPAVAASEPDVPSELSFVQARPERPARPAIARTRLERARPVQQATPSEERLADVAQAIQGAPDEAAVEPAVAESAPVAATQAKMPLPNSTIARTIGRIGYACGEVASTAAVEGAGPGVFTVTCTSGHSYRAAPVRGRYHFRRVGGR